MGPATIRRCFLIVAFAVMAFTLPAQSSELDVASPEELIKVLKANADLVEIRRLAVTNGMEHMLRYLFRLPKRRADPLARRADAGKMFPGLAYSMMHGGDETQIQPLFQGMARYIEENSARYTSEERARLDAFFKRGTGQKRR